METRVDAIERLRAIGYVIDFSAATDGHLHCDLCRVDHGPGMFSIEETVRFEGNSNPDDQSILLALESECGARGQYTAAFGLYVPADDALVLCALARAQSSENHA